MNISLNTNNTQYHVSSVNTSKQNSVNTQSKAQQKTANENKYSSVSEYGDTVQLSSEAKAMLSAQKTQSSQTKEETENLINISNIE